MATFREGQIIIPPDNLIKVTLGFRLIDSGFRLGQILTIATSDELGDAVTEDINESVAVTDIPASCARLSSSLADFINGMDTSTPAVRMSLALTEVVNGSAYANLANLQMVLSEVLAVADLASSGTVTELSVSDMLALSEIFELSIQQGQPMPPAPPISVSAMYVSSCSSSWYAIDNIDNATVSLTQNDFNTYIGMLASQCYGLAYQFDSIQIPANATITNASLSITIRQTATGQGDPLNTGDPVNVTVSFINAKSAGIPTSKSAANAIARTTDIQWNSVPHAGPNLYHVITSPDISLSLQDVINRSDWNSGNSITVVIRQNDGTAARNVYGSFDAQLNLTWERESVRYLAAIAETLRALDKNANTYTLRLLETVSISSTKICAATFLLKECVLAIQSSASNIIGAHSIMENIAGRELVVPALCLVAAEMISVIDSPLYGYGLFVRENAYLNQSVNNILKVPYRTNEQIGIIDLLCCGIVSVVAESLSAIDSILVAYGSNIKEYVILNHAVDSLFRGAVNVLEDIDSAMNAFVVFSGLVSDGISVVDACKIHLQMSVIERLVFIDSILSTGKFGHFVTEEGALNDFACRAYSGAISENITGTDFALAGFTFAVTIAESLGMIDSVMVGLLVILGLDEDILTGDTISVAQRLVNLLSEDISISIDLTDTGIDSSTADTADPWECWVLNGQKFNGSIYTGFNFESFTVFNEETYGLKKDGIYKIEGDSDDGKQIHPGVVFSNTTFGIPNPKNFRLASFGITGEGAALKMESESGSRVYPIDPQKTTLARDVLGRKWTLSVSDFKELDFVELFPVILAR